MDYCGCKCTGSEGPNTLRAVGGRVWEEFEKFLREAEFTSSGGIVPFMKAVGIDPGEARTWRSFGVEKFSRRRINGQGSQDKFAKSRWPLDRGKVARGLILRRRREGPKPIGIRSSAFVGVRVSCSLKSWFAISRSRWNRWSYRGHVARDSRESGFGTSRFLVSKELQRNRETPSCEGSHCYSGWGLIGVVAYRCSGLERSCGSWQ